MKENDGGAYWLGAADAELGRLAFQHRVWAEAQRAVWDRAGFARGQRIVDLGCGPGWSTIDLALRVGPTGEVVAVDRTPRFLAELRRQVERRRLTNVRVVECDVRTVRLEPASVDGVYARWLFCFLSDPAAVVGRLAPALRPGGALVSTDYFNYRAFTFAPAGPALARVVAAVEEWWRRQGGSLEIQGELPAILRRAGLDVTDVTAVCRVARPGSGLWSWPREFYRAFMPELERQGLITSGERVALEREWEERERDGSGYVFLPPLIDIVARKP